MDFDNIAQLGAGAAVGIVGMVLMYKLSVRQMEIIAARLDGLAKAIRELAKCRKGDAE